jgi:hypothetical protein
VIVSFMAVVAAGWVLSSVTIGGISATIHTSRVDGTKAICIASAIVPTGTTANVVITGTTATITQGRLAVFRAVNYAVGTSASVLTSATASASTTHSMGSGGATVWSAVSDFGGIGSRTLTGTWNSIEYENGTSTAAVYQTLLTNPTGGGSQTNTMTWSTTPGSISLGTVNFT